jgi:transcriptional regulator with XRE-family HTH domain
MRTKQNLGLLIRTLRKSKKLSLRDLANMVNMSHVNIAHIENNRVRTNKKTLIQIAIALDYDKDKLLAVADEIGDDIKQIIKNRPSSVPQFLRTAKNLSNDDWKKLSKMVKDMDRDSKSGK